MDEIIVDVSLDTIKQWIWGLENGDPKEVVSVMRQAVDWIEHG
jgi:hypothetical protein